MSTIQYWGLARCYDGPALNTSVPTATGEALRWAIVLTAVLLPILWWHAPKLTD